MSRPDDDAVACPACTCVVTTQHRILDRACPRHGAAADEARRQATTRWKVQR